MLREYIQAAMEKAKYEIIDESAWEGNWRCLSRPLREGGIVRHEWEGSK